MLSSGPRGRRLPGAGDVAGLGGRLTFLFGLLLAMSALTGWYTGEGNDTTVSVIGWHTGTIGKIVLFLGLAAVLLVVLREVGVSMPASVPRASSRSASDRSRRSSCSSASSRSPTTSSSRVGASGSGSASRVRSRSSSPGCSRPPKSSERATGGDRDGHRPHRRFLRNRRQRSDDRLGAARLRPLVERLRERHPEQEGERQPDEDQQHATDRVPAAPPVAVDLASAPASSRR